MAELLFAPEVTFGRLDRSVAKEKLNLLQLATRLVAEASACAAVMPHAALAPLCRMPDYAESLLLAAIWRALRLSDAPDYSA